MINKLEIDHGPVEMTDAQKQYSHDKFQRLDRLMSRHARKSAHARVVFMQAKGKRKTPACEVTINLPGATLNAESKAESVNEAVDLVIDKIERQLRKYKTVNDKSRGRAALRKLLGRK